MSSISVINEQLLKLESRIDKRLTCFLGSCVEDLEHNARAIESLCRAQRALVETQIAIFIEATESELDMPTLPLFCEEREEDPEEGEPDPLDIPYPL